MGPICARPTGAAEGGDPEVDLGAEGGLDDRQQSLDELAPSARASEPEVLTRAELLARQRAVLREAAELLDVSEDNAFLLLQEHGWSLEALSEAFFADPAKAQLAAGVRCAGAGASAGTADAPAQAATGQLCAICFVEAPIELLQCGHSSYCKDCWGQYASTAVEDGRACMDLRCPTPKCNVRLRPGDFRQLLGGDALARYERFALQVFVDGSPDLAWCPGPRCDRAVALPMSQALQIQCRCGTQWCSGCKSDLHAPVTCEVVQKWARLSKNSDAAWLQSFTKPCPKCKSPIEKNGGCMHMTCSTKSSCGHEFCWICLGDWSRHGSSTGGFYACNRYEADKDQVAKERAEAKRFLHFDKRFKEHEQAQTFASTKLRDQVSELVEALVTQKRLRLSAKQVEFLHSAVQETVACRRFLKWTYAYAFVVALGQKQRELFDFHQEQLEGTLERLSDVMENTRWKAYYLDGAVQLQTFDEIKAQVLGLAHVVRGAHGSLSAALQGGCEQGRPPAAAAEAAAAEAATGEIAAGP